MAGTPKAISTERVWIDPATNKEVAPPNAGGAFGWGATNQNAKLYEIITYENGQIWSRTSPDGGKTWGEPGYQETDPQLATNWRADQPKDPGMDTVNVPGKGVVAVDPTTLKPGQVAPGTAPVGDSIPPVSGGYQWNPKTNAYDIKVGDATAQPTDITGGTSTPYILTRMPDGSIKKEVDPNYRAPAAPQGPAFSGTAEGMAYASQLRRDEAIAAGNIAAAQYEASAKTRADELKLEAALRDISDRLNTADANATKEADWARGQPQRDIENTRANSTEARAVSAEQRAIQQGTNAPKIAALQEQATGEMSFLKQLTDAGIAPSMASVQMAYNPYESMWRILNEKPTQGPQMQPPSAPTVGPQVATVGAQAPQAPTIYDSNPSGSGMGGWPPRAPMPYGGDLVAQANFEGMYPGQDPEAIWRAQDAARRAPTAR